MDRSGFGGFAYDGVNMAVCVFGDVCGFGHAGRVEWPEAFRFELASDQTVECFASGHEAGGGLVLYTDSPARMTLLTRATGMYDSRTERASRRRVLVRQGVAVAAASRLVQRCVVGCSGCYGKIKTRDVAGKRFAQGSSSASKNGLPLSQPHPARGMIGCAYSESSGCSGRNQ